MDKLLWWLLQQTIDRRTESNRQATDKVANDQTQNPLQEGNPHAEKYHEQTPSNVCSLELALWSKILSNNTSRMNGDIHVRFCERLKGEIPFCLLGVYLFC